MNDHTEVIGLTDRHYSAYLARLLASVLTCWNPIKRLPKKKCKKSLFCRNFSDARIQITSAFEFPSSTIFLNAPSVVSNCMRKRHSSGLFKFFAISENCFSACRSCCWNFSKLSFFKKKKEIKIKFGIPKYIHFVFSSCNKPPWFFHVSFWPALGQTRISPKRFECWDRAMDPFPRTVLLRRILVRRPPLNSVPSLVRNWCNRSTA